MVVQGAFPSEIPIALTSSLPSSIPYKYPSQSPIDNPSRFPHVVLSVYPYGDTRFVPSYVSSVNSSRSTSEQQVDNLQEESRTIR